MKTYLFWIALIIFAFVGGMFIVKPDTCGAECDGIIKTVDANEFNKQVKKGAATIIDVRTPEEYKEGHIEKAVNADFKNTGEFAKYLDSLDKSDKYMIYCRSGNRFGQALTLMQQKGFKNITNLEGGILAWQSANFTLEK